MYFSDQHLDSEADKMHLGVVLVEISSEQAMTVKNPIGLAIVSEMCMGASVFHRVFQEQSPEYATRMAQTSISLLMS